jgi:hypothetical protein
MLKAEELRVSGGDQDAREDRLAEANLFRPWTVGAAESSSFSISRPTLA